MPKKFHLSWFTSFAVDEWNEPFGSGGSPWDGSFYVDLAKAMERACFDYLMLEDTLMLSEAYGGTSEAYLKSAVMVPKHDPAPLAALVGAATTNLGIVATMSTMAYPPFLLARLCSTLDHIAKGRFGWNIVTSGEDTAAQNFGLDVLPPRELRYEMADEYLSLVNQLFDSWQPGAVLIDRDSRHLRRPRQGRADPLQGQILLFPRSAQHGALATGASGLHPGRRLADRPRLCRRAMRIR